MISHPKADELTEAVARWIEQIRPGLDPRNAFLARVATRSNQKVRMLRAPETVRFLLQVTRIGELLELVDEADLTAPVTSAPDHGLPTIGPAGRTRAQGLPTAAVPDEIA